MAPYQQEALPFGRALDSQVAAFFRTLYPKVSHSCWRKKRVSSLQPLGVSCLGDSKIVGFLVFLLASLDNRRRQKRPSLSVEQAPCFVRSDSDETCVSALFLRIQGSLVRSWL